MWGGTGSRYRGIRIGTCGCRLSPLLCGPRLKVLLRPGRCFGCKTPGYLVERRSDSPGTPLRGPESWRYAQLGNSPEWRGFFPPTLDSPDSLRGVPAIDPQGSRGRNVGRLCRPHSFFSFSNGGRRSSPCLKAGVSAAKKLMIESQSEPTRRAKTELDHRSPARVPSPPQGAARS